MIKRSAYTFAVLQYIHDIASGEVLNIGVVMLAPSERFFKFDIRAQIGRLKGAFPNIDRHAFKVEVEAITRALRAERAVMTRAQADLPWAGNSATDVVRRLFPTLASSFQWARDGGGLARDLDAEFASLTDRFLDRYQKDKPRVRKDDGAVWAPIRNALTAAKVMVEFTEETIKSTVDEITFQHAWRNGRMHVYEPVSLDYLDARDVRHRARSLRGQLDAVGAGAAHDVSLNVIIGAPSDPKLRRELDAEIKAAAAIISGAQMQPRIWYDDKDQAALVAEISEGVRAHREGIH